MISLTSIDTVCSSSKWSRKKQVIAKKPLRPPPAPPSKSASEIYENYMWSTAEFHSWTADFSSLCRWSYIFFQFIKSYNVCRRHTFLYQHKNIIKFFATVNEELINKSDWFMVYKLSLNVRKTKYSIFHKSRRVHDPPFKLPKLSINNKEIKTASYTKFLGVL